MITEKQVDAIVKTLTDRVNQANTYFLKQIGASIKKIGGLSPSKAQQLVQMLKYGGDYDKIINELSKILDSNVKSVDKIFDEYAKKDQMFYRDFYKYRDASFVEYANNLGLKRQTQSLANVVKNDMYNFTRDNVLGYTYKDLDGNIMFNGLKDTYNKLLDNAMLYVGQGKETFDVAMKDIMQEIGASGLKTLDFASGRSVRLDSMVKMHLKSRLRELHNENQKLIAKDIDADGVEISVHMNPAPDHQDAQGHQFTNDEFNRLQEYGTATDVNGKVIDMHRLLKSGDTTDDYRPISEMNCYHYIFAVVLGVNKPQYTDEQLEEIKNKNMQGFDFEGKHYTNYEGTQLQRRIETQIRREKDIKVLGEASGNNSLISTANSNIKALQIKYKQLTEASGLKGKPKNMVVSKPKTEPKVKSKVEKVVPEAVKVETPKVELMDSKYEKRSKIFAHSKQWLDLTDEDNIKIYNGTNKININIYERKNLKSAYYSRYEKSIHTTGVNTENLNDKDATTTLWHETGHALDNYKGGNEYASNNKDMRMSMFDWYRDNPDVPDKVKTYFNDEKERINVKLKNEFSDKIISKEEYTKEQMPKLKEDDWYSEYSNDELQKVIDNAYDVESDRYVRLHRRDDMEYAQIGNLSDMFSAISNGNYEWCKRWGYHTKTYYTRSVENPTTELFANFTSLKMTGCKKHLELFKEVAPDIYIELDKLYKKIGDDLSAK